MRGGEPAWATTPLAVAQDLDNHRLQFVVGCVVGAGRGQLVLCLGEAPPPSGDALRIDAQLRCHIDRLLARGGAEHDVHALGDPSLDGA